MRRSFAALTLSFVSAFAVTGTTNGAGPVQGRAELGCPSACLLVPVVPFTPGPAGCLIVDLPLACAPRPMAPPPCDPPTPVVKVKVRVPACGPPGAPIEYRICVYNDSPADAHHVLVKNALPANARFVRASPEPHVKEPELQWRLGTLKAGGGVDITLILRPTNAEDVRNCTRVAFEHGQCVTTRLAQGGSPLRSPEDGPPRVIPVPKLPTEKEPPVLPGAEDKAQLTLSIEGPKTQYLNVPARYFITVTNKGKAAAKNLLVNFTLAKKTTFEKAIPDAKPIDGMVAWILGTLEPGASQRSEVVLKSPVGGELCHTAKALADKGVKAQTEFCTTFSGVSAVLMDMSDTEDPIPVGGGTSYPVLIRNVGTAVVTNLRLKAVIGDGVIFKSAKSPVNHAFSDPLPAAQVLLFDSLAKLEPGAQAEFVIFVLGAKPADVRFRVELRADQLEGGPIVLEESTRVYAEDSGTGTLPPVRDTSLTRPYRP